LFRNPEEGQGSQKGVIPVVVMMMMMMMRRPINIIPKDQLLPAKS
jgi:hypothetical protein